MPAPDVDIGVVMVRWGDASSHGGEWVSPANVNHMIVDSWVVGMVVKDDKDGITVAQAYQPDKGLETISDLFTIPRGMVREVWRSKAWKKDARK